MLRQPVTCGNTHSTYESIRATASDASLTLSSNSSPCERRRNGGAGGATTPVARGVRSRSTGPRRRSSNRSWTRSSWSAPCILQLQGASVVALRFLLRFPAFSQKEQNGPFFTFSWRFQKAFTSPGLYIPSTARSMMAGRPVFPGADGCLPIRPWLQVTVWAGLRLAPFIHHHHYHRRN